MIACSLPHGETAQAHLADELALGREGLGVVVRDHAVVLGEVQEGLQQNTLSVNQRE